MTGWEMAGGGGVVVAILGLFVGSLRRKRDVSSCKREHEHVDGRFKSGNTKFSKLEDKTDKLLDGQHAQGLILTKVATTVEALARKNGIGE
jgi:hypothetical protein